MIFQFIRNIYYAILKPILDLIHAPARVKIYLLYPNTDNKFYTGIVLGAIGWIAAIVGMGLFLMHIFSMGVELTSNQFLVCVIGAQVGAVVFLWGMALYEEAKPFMRKLRKARVQVL